MSDAAGSPADVPRRFVDLHAHTTASDGTAAPSALVQAAVAANLAAIAVTDHDTVAGVDEAVRAAPVSGIRVVPGVELSAVDSSGETHLLGLHLSDLGRVHARLSEMREMRQKRAERIVQRLAELGINVTMGHVAAQSGAATVGRPHVARALVALGVVPDLRTAFDRYLAAGRPAFVPKEPLSIADAIAIVHAAGGIAILAHPGVDATPARLESLAAAGLDGVEVKHPSHHEGDARRILALCDRLGLVPSGGSDWHGHQDPARAIGSMRVPSEWLDRQDDRVSKAARARVA